jgi:imidazole glycerol-phosphate synthase subunit HisH
MNDFGIVDYGMGNLGSVLNACRFLDLDARLVASPDALEDCRAIILPGVGAFGDCMAHLREHGFVAPLRAWIEADKPFLGICLGLQVLFEGSEESPKAEGLAVLPGVVRRFQLPADYKVPQIGWNRVRYAQPDCPLFTEVPDQSYFYFVHSYYADAAEAPFTSGITDYGIPYTSCIWRGRVMAAQFHPEKSQQRGLRMLRNFSALVTNTKGTR